MASDKLTKEEEREYVEKARVGDGVAFSWDTSTHYFERTPYPVRVELFGNDGVVCTVPWIGF